MKKKLLFVIESLNLGGAEKSLVSLLNTLDCSKYEVDLQLFAYGGTLEKYIPNQVNILPMIDYFKYVAIPYKNINKKIKSLDNLKSQIEYSIKLRTNTLDKVQQPVELWRSCSENISISQNRYDVAIAYAQGLPTFYVADKIIADKKIAWINVSYFPKDQYYDFINDKYNQFDYVNCVSESCFKQVKDYFPVHKNNLSLIRDIISYDLNYKLSFEESFINSENTNKLLTVGRLVKQKGYDIALEACFCLKNQGLSFKWYIIGEGDQRQFIESKIKEYQLENYMILLGAKENPYPYFKDCDIYVQTSKFEGYGITLAEARMFNKPIVTTNFDAVKDQIINDVNGMIVDMNGESVAKGIIKMMKDETYRNKLVEYLKTQSVDNRDEINKFYKLIED